MEIKNDNTRGHAGWCLEIHDLLISKCVAGRPKDIRFLGEALRAGMASPSELLVRLEMTPIEEALRERIRALINQSAG